MLICPQCKSENSDNNKFCQNCGTSLISRACPQCGTIVAVNTHECDNCGAECGTVWWTIITTAEVGDALHEVEIGGSTEIASSSVEDLSPEEATMLQEGSRSNSPTVDDSLTVQVPVTTATLDSMAEETENVSASQPPPICLSYSTSLHAGSFLDSQYRYQLLESIEEIGDTGEVYVRVLDCKPYQVSPLEVMVANKQQSLVMPSTEASRIPSFAIPYITLQSQLHEGIPKIHDAWQQDNIQVILLEDRSHWQHLVDLWHDDSISSLQIVHCFYQMTKLWVLLETVNCRQSLLEWSNLRLDEDQKVALQRLYVESNKQNIPQSQLSQGTEAQIIPPEEQPSIKTLGRIWQALFRQSQRTQFGAMVQLLGEVEVGQIQTVSQLQLRLQAIANDLQGITSVPEIRTSSPTTLQLDDEEQSPLKVGTLPTALLPMQLVSLENVGLTDVGRQRDHNEDYYGIETQVEKVELPSSRTVEARGLYILCDGMGGHAGGEVASALAVNKLRQYFQTHWVSNQLPTEAEIREAVRQANQEIYDLNQQDARSGVGRMGTTLVMILIQDTRVAVAHVGDSRLYSLTRKQGLKQITIDHEVGQREISRGVEPEIAYARPDAYQLTQALGPRDENFIFPDVQFFKINEDTLFILASDGLSDNDLLESHGTPNLESLLNSSANLEDGVIELIDLANHYNGHDNITAVLIRAEVRPHVEGGK
ncbi:MAG: serine/threonine phosphatase [Rhizonema sp. PD38]|nr:serine/threonine phosphatase [Rhizonema sp. PD38]